MAADDFFSVSTIKHSLVKKLAENCNTETDNDTIDTESEWKDFLSGIAHGYGSGTLDYNTAREYTESSSSVFVQNDRLCNAYKKGFLAGMDVINAEDKSQVSIKILNMLNPGEFAKEILDCAEFFETQEKMGIYYEEMLETSEDSEE